MGAANENKAGNAMSEFQHMTTSFFFHSDIAIPALFHSFFAAPIPTLVVYFCKIFATCLPQTEPCSTPQLDSPLHSYCNDCVFFSAVNLFSLCFIIFCNKPEVI